LGPVASTSCPPSHQLIDLFPSFLTQEIFIGASLRRKYGPKRWREQGVPLTREAVIKHKRWGVQPPCRVEGDESPFRGTNRNLKKIRVWEVTWAQWGEMEKEWMEAHFWSIHRPSLGKPGTSSGFILALISAIVPIAKLAHWSSWHSSPLLPYKLCNCFLCPH
jgi:hypothetical protein